MSPSPYRYSTLTAGDQILKSAVRHFKLSDESKLWVYFPGIFQRALADEPSDQASDAGLCVIQAVPDDR
jgi:hypothetical protein